MNQNEKQNLNNDREEPQRFRHERHLHYHAHCHSGGVVWGLLLVMAGALFLLNNLGIISWEIWNFIVGFWPIFLVFAGINLILGQNVFSRIIVGLVALASFILILGYGLYAVNSPLINSLPPQLVDIIMFIGNLKK